MGNYQYFIIVINKAGMYKMDGLRQGTEFHTKSIMSWAIINIENFTSNWAWLSAPSVGGQY